MDLTAFRMNVPHRRMWLGRSVSGIGAALTGVVTGLQAYDISTPTAAIGVAGLVGAVPLVPLQNALLAGSPPGRAAIVPCRVAFAMVGSLSPGPPPTGASPTGWCCTGARAARPEPLRLRGRPGHGTVGRVIGTQAVRIPDLRGCSPDLHARRGTPLGACALSRRRTDRPGSPVGQKGGRHGGPLTARYPDRRPQHGVRGGRGVRGAFRGVLRLPERPHHRAALRRPGRRAGVLGVPLRRWAQV